MSRLDSLYSLMRRLKYPEFIWMFFLIIYGVSALVAVVSDRLGVHGSAQMLLGLVVLIIMMALSVFLLLLFLIKS